MSQTTPFIEYANIGDVKVAAKYDLESYQQGKADGAREFAEWLCGKYRRMKQGSIGFEIFQNIYWKPIDEVLAEWQKEVNHKQDLGHNPYQE